MRIIILFLVAVGFQNKSFAWGQYGHQQISRTAIGLLPLAGIGKCLRDAQTFVIRGASVPDIEWKKHVALPFLTSEELAQRDQIDLREHSLHFWEFEAFVPDLKNIRASDIQKLAVSDFQSVYPFMSGQLTRNQAQVSQMDPGKVPSANAVNNVTDHGTAPWRVLQLYHVSAQAFAAKNIELGLTAAATLAHYKEDMTQPFHASLNYDGKFPESAGTAGIHAIIDTGVLPNTPVDPASGVHQENVQFAAAVRTVATSILQSSPNKVVAAEYVVRKIVDLVAEAAVSSGLRPSLINQFLTAYKAQCDRANANLQPNRPPACVVAHHSNNLGMASESVPRLPAAFEAVLEEQLRPAIVQRLGQSAALLAMIWRGIEAEARTANPTVDWDHCSQWNRFTQAESQFVISNYPSPDDPQNFGYLPQGFTPHAPHGEPVAIHGLEFQFPKASL